jgi:Zn-dependent peptidase ImmA (M78 family)/plasmid maintenance system antidote protein VapI
MNNNAFEPDWFSRPGDTLVALMEQKELTCDALASKLSCQPNVVRGLISGTVPIDGAMATSLAKIVGGSEAFWLKRQSSYQASLDRVANSLPPGTTDAWLKSFPVRDIAEYGWIKRPTKREDLLKAYLAFFGVQSPKEWERRYADVARSALFRTSVSFESKVGALSAWLRQAEIEAAGAVTEQWDARKLRASLEQLRILTKAKAPEYFLPRIRTICARAGVAVVFVRPPTGCRASGATRFLGPDKAFVALSFRHLSDDHFWFTLFHEIGHLLLHGQDQTFLDVDRVVSSDAEKEANNFAANVLIPPNKREELVSLPAQRDRIVRFAYSIGVSAGIVVGQMQYSKALRPNQMNFLKRRYDWASLSAVLP